MRVLIVAQATPHLPTHDRARAVPAYLLSHLASSHEIALVAPCTPGDTPLQRAWAGSLAAHVTHVPVTRWRHALTGAPGDALAAVRAATLRVTAEWTPDVVHLEGAVLAPLARALQPAPVVVACRESAVRRARDTRRLARTPREWMRAQLEEPLEAEWERRWLPAARACIAGSEEDRRTLAERVPAGRIEVIPGGVDESRYEFRRGGEAARLIFAGNLAWPAHHEAARRLALRVLPLVRRVMPQAELLVVGGGPAAALRGLGEAPGVRVGGATADLRPSLWSAAAALVPAEAAPAVDAAALEAMALGTPLITAPRALGGLDHVLPGHHVLAAESDAELAEAALLVLRQPVVAATLAANARQLVERRYTWAALARAYTSLWARVADAAPAAVAA